MKHTSDDDGMEVYHKSREQKFHEFFIILQKEWIVAELRYIIYTEESMRVKSKEIMEGKKKKIYDIAFKNSIKTIFPDLKLGNTSLYDECLKDKLYDEIYRPGGGLPHFIYRDDRQKSILAGVDRRCYYSIGSKFNVVNSDLIGIIETVDFVNSHVLLRFDNGKAIYDLKEITRLF
jgi:hypothetical protein